MKFYTEPTVDVLYLQNEDVLTTSDNAKEDIFDNWGFLKTGSSST